MKTEPIRTPLLTKREAANSFVKATQMKSNKLIPDAPTVVKKLSDKRDGFLIVWIPIPSYVICGFLLFAAWIGWKLFHRLTQ